MYDRGTALARLTELPFLSLILVVIVILSSQ